MQKNEESRGPSETTAKKTDVFYTKKANDLIYSCLVYFFQFVLINYVFNKNKNINLCSIESSTKPNY